MAKSTPQKWRALNIYSIQVRNFSTAGTFNAIHSDLDRIHYLGTDIILFLPFYPLIVETGNHAIPYKMKDLRQIDARYGTKEEFELLVKEIHKRNMKVMIDIGFNHTADPILIEEYPDWFDHKAANTINKEINNSADLIILDDGDQGLWEDQIEILKEWAKLVDGFHCETASLIPLEFWRKARSEIQKNKPHFIWLAETLERDLIKRLRKEHLIAYSDSELYTVFDLTYDYDVQKEYEDYLTGNAPLSKYIDALNRQDSTYPWNYVKVCFLENHKYGRMIDFLPDIDSLIQWAAFNYLQKGATLIYNGQEVASKKLPHLFDKDPIDWDTGINLSSYIAHLAQIKKDHVPIVNVEYDLQAFDALDTIVMYYVDQEEKRIGVFNLKHKVGKVPIAIPDGEYQNLLNNHLIEIEDGQIELIDSPVFFIANY